MSLPIITAEVSAHYILNISQNDSNEIILSKYADRISDVDCGNFLKEINSEFDSRKDATHAVLLFTGVVKKRKRNIENHISFPFLLS